jgi:protein-tyrosine phosphatase|tara:strand:+ start:18159 stop:18656 length:498 start_codon:yes stop_codon:yes gene_type:complete
MSIRVLFVCLGNICRSPTAEGIFRARVQAAQLEQKIHIDSAGTGDWHVGKSPDSRAQQHGLEAGYNISDLRARQVCPKDFGEFDYIVAMDRQNLSDLEAMRPTDFRGSLGLLLDFDTSAGSDDVPDPYSLDASGFKRAISLIEGGCDALLIDIQQRFLQTKSGGL